MQVCAWPSMLPGKREPLELVGAVACDWQCPRGAERLRDLVSHKHTLCGTDEIGWGERYRTFRLPF